MPKSQSSRLVPPQKRTLGKVDWETENDQYGHPRNFTRVVRHQLFWRRLDLQAQRQTFWTRFQLRNQVHSIIFLPVSAPTGLSWAVFEAFA